MTTDTTAAAPKDDRPIPASFLPPPKRERKRFADVPLMDGAQGENIVFDERRLARAVWALLVGVEVGTPG